MVERRHSSVRGRCQSIGSDRRRRGYHDDIDLMVHRSMMHTARSRERRHSPRRKVVDHLDAIGRPSAGRHRTWFPPQRAHFAAMQRSALVHVLDPVLDLGHRIQSVDIVADDDGGSYAQPSTPRHGYARSTRVDPRCSFQMEEHLQNEPRRLLADVVVEIDALFITVSTLTIPRCKGAPARSSTYLVDLDRRHVNTTNRPRMSADPLVAAAMHSRVNQCRSPTARANDPTSLARSPPAWIASA